MDELSARLEQAAAVEGSGGGKGVSAGFTFAHSCTLWVGNIPAEFVGNDSRERKLKQAFVVFGTLAAHHTYVADNETCQICR